jgi:hypothetical protein
MHGRLLVAYGNASNYVKTTAEYLDSLQHSGFDVRYVHVTHNAVLDFDINDFDVLFQSYCARMPFVSFEAADCFISPDYQAKLKQFRGLKLLAVQDEYDRTDNLRKAIAAFQFDAVFTAVPEEGKEYVYPKAMFPRTEFVNVLTGYVPETLERRSIKPEPLARRPITIGYRGRELPAYYGSLGFEKAEIGRRVKAACEARGIPHDIDVTEQSRFYGDAWYDFLGRCRTALGSESGCNVFDFDGSIGERYRRIVKDRGVAPRFEEFRTYTDALENQISMGQISPRIFEAAAMRTPLILLTGRYSGLVRSGEHYIELKKDFSNFDAVFARLEDLDGLESMAHRAYEHLVGSGRFSYRQFGKFIGETAWRMAESRGLRFRDPLDRFDHGDDFNPSGVDLVVRPTPQQRHSAVFWTSQYARENFRLCAALAGLQQELSRIRNPHRYILARLVGRRVLRALPDRLSRRVKDIALRFLVQH